MALFKKLFAGIKNNKWVSGIAKLFSGKSFSDEFWDELENNLIAGDTGIDFTEEIIDFLKDEAKSKKLKTPAELKDVFINKIVDELNTVKGMGEDFKLTPKPYVLLMIGVNGSGKTTSAGKLAAKFQAKNQRVVMAAADTFRAAAVEQLKIWGERSNIRVISHSQGGDPAAVAFDAYKAAENSNADVLIVDTAGRLHDKHNLMQELEKIHRVLLREAGSERVENVLVLDAMLGQNSVMQAKTFNNIIPISSIILTKYDNTSKGGVILSIARELKIPVKYLGLGENPDDLKNFSSEEFAASLLEVN